MAKRWKDERMYMTHTLRQALQGSIKDGEVAYAELERVTGVKRQSLMKFARGEQSLRLDMAEKLAQHFRYRFECYASPDMEACDIFEYVKSYFWENKHLRKIFGEKYLQHALYEALWHHYGDFLEYECQYDAIIATNEIDLAIPWELAIEVKWLKANAPNRSRDNHPVKVAQKIANLCRLAYIKHDQQCEQRESQCWLVFGGQRNAFSDFYSFHSKRAARNSEIAACFFPYDPMNSVMEIPLKLQIEELSRQHTEVFKELAVSIRHLELPESIRVKSHGTEQIWNDDYDFCCIGWEVARVSSETFVVT